MNLKNYKISESQIELIALLLIEKNGKTTNLDIKNQFRSTGFYVTQAEVSTAMTNMETAGKFNSTNNGKFKTFTYPKVTASPSVINIAQAIGRSNRKTSIVISSLTSKLITPLKGKFVSTAIIQDIDKVYAGAWMVSNKDRKSVLYMHKTITRNQAISKFAKETGFKYDDVRCRKVK